MTVFHMLTIVKKFLLSARRAYMCWNSTESCCCFYSNRILSNQTACVCDTNSGAHSPMYASTCNNTGVYNNHWMWLTHSADFNERELCALLSLCFRCYLLCCVKVHSIRSWICGLQFWHCTVIHCHCNTTALPVSLIAVPINFRNCRTYNLFCCLCYVLVFCYFDCLGTLAKCAL